MECKHCNKLLIKRQTTFCSQSCKSLFETKRVELNCKNCNRLFEVKQAELSRGGGLYCGRLCFSSRPKEMLKWRCQQCGKEKMVIPFRAKKRFCNRACSDLAWSVMLKEHYKSGKRKSQKDKKISAELRRKIIKNLFSSGDQMNENNPQWRGDNVALYGLHKWVRSKMPHDGECVLCHKKTNELDLSNRTGEYNRDFENWWYLCRKCHSHYDQNLVNAWKSRGIGNKYK